MENKDKDNNNSSKNNKSMCKHVFLDLNEKSATIIENVLNEYCVPYKKTESDNNHGAGGNRGIAIIPFLIMPCDMDEDDFGCKYNIEVELISEPASEGKLSPLEFVLKKVEERLALEASYKLPTVEPKIPISPFSTRAEIKNNTQVDLTKYGNTAFTSNVDTNLTNSPRSYKNTNINKLSNCFEDIMQEILDEEKKKNKFKNNKNKKKNIDNKKVPKAFEELMGWNSKSKNNDRKDRKDNKSHLSGLQPIHDILPYIFADMLLSPLYTPLRERRKGKGRETESEKEKEEKRKIDNNSKTSSRPFVKFDELPELIKGILRSNFPESILKSDNCRISYNIDGDKVDLSIKLV